MVINIQPSPRLPFSPSPILIYLITGGETTAKNFARQFRKTLKLIERAVKAEISLVQIREKRLSARLVFRLASEAVKITKGTTTKLLVNDRADIALAAGADGVHLPANSLPAGIIRGNFPPGFIIGVSAHGIKEAEKAKLQNADFVTFGPVFATPSKAKYGPPQGAARLRRICQKLKPFPVVALGGINEYNFAEALRAGAKGVAAIRFLSEAEKLSEISRKIREFERKNE
jgi:thiamine-phosphate pyrophosphorylase